MKKLAEMIRRAENGRRIRLTRKGKLVAFIVPPDDMQRLEWLEEQERQFHESEGRDDLGPSMSDYDEPAYAEPEPAYEARGREPEPPPPPRHVNFDDERQRQRAIASFRKGFDRILSASELLSRGDIARRLKEDGYIASAMLGIIGEA
jgi:antitoxin (DNA-binding transcriptional repressor) of toxin-antitoxin stability system